MADNYKYYLKRQQSAPTKPCECGCGEMIPIVTMRGTPMRFKNGHSKRGKLHWNWNNGRYKKDGYWYVKKPQHHYADSKGYVLEHRLVYEEHYKCILLPWIEIHHINHKRDDNRIENLAPVTRKQHRELHKINMDDRICLLCDHKTTKFKPNGTPCWFVFENGFICSKCYMKNYDALYRNK